MHAERAMQVQHPEHPRWTRSRSASRPPLCLADSAVPPLPPIPSPSPRAKPRARCLRAEHGLVLKDHEHTRKKTPHKTTLGNGSEARGLLGVVPALAGSIARESPGSDAAGWGNSIQFAGAHRMRADERRRFRSAFQFRMASFITSCVR